MTNPTPDLDRAIREAVEAPLNRYPMYAPNGNPPPDPPPSNRRQATAAAFTEKLLAAAVAEYHLEHPSEDAAMKVGRRCAIRGVMVRLGLYGQFETLAREVPHE